VSDADVEPLLEYLKQTRGFDFTGYKRTSLERRIRHRLDEIGIDSYGDYLDHLEVHPEEFPFLFNTILINVTSFFRDPQVWEYIGKELIPSMARTKPEGEPFRVWCAACASGEEAYTAAMVLAEALGIERYRDRVKIYGTDVDEDALTTARHGIYDAKQLESVPEPLRERYFEQTNARYVFRRDLRRTVIFGRNDLVQDAPISRVDLLICRNALIYFTAEAQTQILQRLNFALRDEGVLVVGKSEMLVKQNELFRPLDMKMRLFRKLPRRVPRERYAFVVQGNGEGLPGEDAGGIREAAIDAAPVPQIVVDAAGTLVFANHQARTTFKLSAGDIGRPLQDLEISYRPAELRSTIEQAFDERRPVLLGRVEWNPGPGEGRMLDILVTPVISQGQILGSSISFADVTGQRRLQDELDRSRRELEVAYEELQSTIEELETTNEELQSTNEELETTNEELQSTNEELETMNEELQSVNEELETTNDELRARGRQVDQVNGFLETVLSRLGTGVVVVDDDQRIQIWNDQAEQMWGLRPSEAEGQHLMNLDIGLPVDELKAPIRAALSGEGDGHEVLDVAAINRLGKSITCRVTTMPLRGGDSKTGVVLLMEAVG
jgi:two-component system, chemotaxis family, CheB/CheR fusion protein